MDNPSKRLAKTILERLVEEKILLVEDSKKMLEKFSSGKLKQEDWRLPIEIAGDKEGK